MELSGLLEVPAALRMRKETTVPFGWEARQAPDPVWSLEKKKISWPRRE
jgi:hypothetical protein